MGRVYSKMNLKYYMEHPLKILFRLGQYSFLKYLNDEQYIRLLWKANFNCPLNLDNPQTFNEKIQWLKLNYRDSVFTLMADKYEVKKYVAALIGDEHIIPTYGVWDNMEDIKIEELPVKFVLKTTHDSGGIVICKDKLNFDFKAAKKKLNNSMKHNYYYSSREWPYKDIKPRILAEQYVQNYDRDVLDVYKIFNFNGKPKIIQTIQNDKTKNETIDYFDIEWNLLPFRQNFPNSKSLLNKPKKLETMLELAKTLSQGFPFLRTDFYEVDNNVYFSEFTFYSDSGMAYFEPREWDYKLGSMIDLSSVTNQN